MRVSEERDIATTQLVLGMRIRYFHPELTNSESLEMAKCMMAGILPMDYANCGLRQTKRLPIRYVLTTD